MLDPFLRNGRVLLKETLGDLATEWYRKWSYSVLLKETMGYLATDWVS